MQSFVNFLRTNPRLLRSALPASLRAPPEPVPLRLTASHNDENSGHYYYVRAEISNFAGRVMVRVHGAAAAPHRNLLKT